MQPQKNLWLALAIGNTRLHWALFADGILEETWDSNHLGESENSPLLLSPPLCHSPSPPLYLASVVPEQTALWLFYPEVRVISLDQVPLLGVYSTLGIDRALAVLGAGKTFGWPILVMDAGTAFTFTGADGAGQLVGGAILPGLTLQVKSLAQGTAALPEIELPATLPPRWSLNTTSAIQSGIIHTVLAGIADFMEAWGQEFPESRIVLTGGSSTSILSYLQALFPLLAAKVTVDPHLIFWGMRSIVIAND
ncbi:pantothenate kinase [Argonema galeatum]|uniref:pantothenate kinase n=1 Tax=Argonema galeatum TaxID=2942762 RepID=UPI0020124B39|nr:pantothenate kinase [Argonema galeatum A003/A1]